MWFWYNDEGLPNKKYVYKSEKLISKELVFYENKKAIGINFDSISYVYTSAGITYIKKMDNTIFKPSNKFTEIIELLGVDNFLQINKNFLANYASIKGIQAFEGGFYKVQLSIQPEFDVIAEEESSKALKIMFPDLK